MFELFRFHEIAARRGDGLRPEFFGLLPEQPLRERLTLIRGGVTEANQPTPACDKSHELTTSRLPSLR